MHKCKHIPLHEKIWKSFSFHLSKVDCALKLAMHPPVLPRTFLVTKEEMALSRAGKKEINPRRHLKGWLISIIWAAMNNTWLLLGLHMMPRKSSLDFPSLPPFQCPFINRSLSPCNFQLPAKPEHPFDHSYFSCICSEFLTHIR